MQKNHSTTPDIRPSSTYQTGSTTPPKSHNGVIALLLVLIIVLCGIITVLGITNVRMFQMISGQESDHVAISLSGSRMAPTFGSEPVEMRETPCLSCPLGLEGESVPVLYQLYYGLPKGLHILSVDPASCAGSIGISPGDILTAVDDMPIASPQDLQDLLRLYDPGDTVMLTVYRKGQLFRVEVAVQPHGGN